MERALIAQYEQDIEEMLQRLTAENLPASLELARLPEQIRGFGHVKVASIKLAQTRRTELRAVLGNPQAAQRAA